MRTWIALVASLAAAATLFAQREHGFDNTKPSGQAYWGPEESLKGFKTLDGWEVKLFAAEPDVINPIAFTIDEKGRIWVVECFEYPRRTPRDRMPQDCIKILEDTDGDGRCDRVTSWAEGKDFPVRFDLASGIEVGHGGVFLGAPPYLFHLRDPQNEGKCTKHEILLTGFGSQDTHETLNTFQWGPDGRLYGLHGVFTQSEVQGVKLNAAVWRYDVRGKKFEVFAEGTSNPWGMDFDPRGQCFLTCCVIPHLFHMVQGGVYIRQAGESFNPYAFGQLKEICDHTHHKESGWAHAGLLYLEGRHVPDELQGSVLMGSIHGCSIKRDSIRRNGSTYLAGHEPDFLTSADKNFRPINMRWGPDGSIYLIDWHDQNPCHQAAPDSWDKKHGRIYRIQKKGIKNTPPGDWAKKSDQELIDALLDDDNPWKYRTALRLLGERRGKVAEDSVAFLRRKVLQAGDSPANLRALWALFALDKVEESLAVAGLDHANPWVRAWCVRLLGEGGRPNEKTMKRLTDLAAGDKSADVRLQLASTAGRLARQNTRPILESLLQRDEDHRDPCIPLMIWLALEPQIVADNSETRSFLNWLKEKAPGNRLITNEIVPRTMRRLAASGNAEDLAACIQFIREASATDVRLAALRGLSEQLKGKTLEAPAGWQELRADLAGVDDPEIRKLTAQLAINFQEVQAIRNALAAMKDLRRPERERVEAIRSIALVRPAEALKPLIDLVVNDKNEAVRRAAVAALAGYDDRSIPATLLENWKNLPPAVRSESVHTLKARRDWASQLLDAVGKGTVAAAELDAGVIVAIRNFHDAALNEKIEKVWGKVRSTPQELDKLIADMRQQMHRGKGDAGRGKQVFEKNCAQCHRFDGQGHDLGPPLDGAERSLDYLLVNILDPNRVVGRPYFQRIVLHESGKLSTGLLHAEDANSITLKKEKDELEVIPKKEIARMRIEEKSLMPEGLDKNMTEQDLRDLVRYLMANPFLTEVRLSEMIEVAGGFERQQPVEKGDPLQAEGVRWTEPEVGPAGLIRLQRQAIRGQMVDSFQYLYAEVSAPHAMKTRLLIGSNFPVKAWINGKLVYSGKLASPTLEPDQIVVEVALAEGVNRILLKIMNSPLTTGVYVRLHDPERKLVHPIPKP